MGRLGKRDVEELLEAVEAAGDDVEELREALLVPLARAVDRSGSADWVTLVDVASERGGWSRDRWASLRLAATPERLGAAETAETRDALFDLAAELNECRSLSGGSGPGGGDAR